jgi:nanoRNase/pAp phosphatase (c-di-AMP/oligoRNAs hydrolase)
MTLAPQEQFKKFLDISKEVLILIPENPSTDAVGSAWALYYFLERKNLIPTIAFSNHLSSKLSFLPRPGRILNEISGARDFVLSFDIERNKIKSIRHEERDGKFNIYLTPDKGALDPRDFSFILAKFKYDLIITIDCQDFEKLGKIYLENTDLFFEVPVVNIDHRSDNDNFGKINLVDVMASSSSELLYRIFQDMASELLSQDIATCLLAGIIGATESFQNKNTSPRSLTIASELMDKGADQQDIIRWLYKTHPLPILKLWGRAMAKLNLDNDLRLVWSEISLDDFVQSRSNPQDLSIILEKLKENYSEGEIFMTIFNDTPDSSTALIKTNDPETARKIVSAIKGEVSAGGLEIKLNKSNLGEAGKEIVENIRKALSH